MFANPWALMVGIAAAALPVVIHWLTRPRPTRFPVSTLRFIQGAVAQRRARYRLRDLLVLLCRTGAVLLLAFTIARPLLHQQQPKEAAGTAGITRIILLDCSQSMAARDGGIVRFERARPVVADLLKYEPSLKCNLLLAGASPQAVFDGPTTNLGALREALTGAAVRPERLRVQQALTSITEMFEQANPDSELQVVIVSDFQRSNWATVDFSVLPERCEAQLKSVTSDDEAANMAVLDLTTDGRLEAGREADVAVRLGNFSDTPRTVRVELSVGSIVIPLEGHCPARSQTSLAGRLPIDSDGWLTGSVRIVSSDDALPADDSLPIGLQARPPPRLAVLTRDKVDRTGSAAWYVDRALAASLSGVSTPDAIIHTDAADPDVEILRSADIVVAARPGRLSNDLIAVLTAMLQRGRSLLYVASDQLDATNLNALTAALGSSARMPVEYLPRPGERGGVKRFLTTVDRRRSPFVVFGDELAAAISSLEFTGGLISRSTAEGLQDDVRATLNDQSSFLSITAAGRGRLAVLNVDLERSNLPRTPVLVPLLGELLSRDLASLSEESSAFQCGEPFTLQLSVGEEEIDNLTVSGPAATVPEKAAGRFTAVPQGVVWDVAAAGAPGVYEVKVSDRTVGAAVTAIPEEESDLRTLSADVFTGRLSGGRKLQFGSGSTFNEETQDVTWVWLAAACMTCILLELLTLRLFRI
ncbi:MAG: BatA and WFA domain-containing protein [Fuerstiella sp.]